MKSLTALVAALGVLGFAGAAAANCPSGHMPTGEQTAETPIPILPETAGS